jgi:hypothetical protein
VLLEPGQFLQLDPFAALGLSDLDINAAISLRVDAGGAVAAYASVVDNGTQDPILIPALVTYRQPR